MKDKFNIIIIIIIIISFHDIKSSFKTLKK